MHIRDADRVAYSAGLKLAQADPDGPPLAALTWPDDYWITGQRPSPGSRLRRWDPLIVTWSASPADGGVREPRRPVVPTKSLVGDPNHRDQDAAFPSQQRIGLRDDHRRLT